MLIAKGAFSIHQALPSSFIKWLFVFVWLIILGGTNFVARFRTPIVFSQLRTMIATTKEHPVYLSHFAQPAAQFYALYHPQKRHYFNPKWVLQDQQTSIQSLLNQAEIYAVYDLVTYNDAFNEITRDSLSLN